MPDALFMQIQCEQPACSTVSVALISAYAAGATAAILAFIYFVRKRASDRGLR